MPVLTGLPVLGQLISTALLSCSILDTPTLFDSDQSQRGVTSFECGEMGAAEELPGGAAV